MFRHDPTRFVVSVIAPPGYGKTTLLAQLVARATHGSGAVWLRLDDVDNDPAVLVADLQAALDAASSGSTWTGHPRLPPTPDRRTAASALMARLQLLGRPAILVLDDIQRLVSRASLDVIEQAIDHVPPGIRVVVAGRTEPELALGRYRVEGHLLEIRMDALALDDAETAALVAATGCDLDAAEVRTMRAHTEGWAAATYLAALAAVDGCEVASTGAASGGDAYIAGYLRSELGRELSDEDATLLTRSAVLETIPPGAAEAITGADHGGERLRALAERNQLIFALDPGRLHLRFHTILREYLLMELERREPGATPRLHRQAADWYRSNGQPDVAVRHASAAGDWRLAAEIVTDEGSGTPGEGIDACLLQFDRIAFERYPPLAVAAAWRYLLSGRDAAADDMADIAERSTYREQPFDGSASFESQRAMLRAVMGRRGPGFVLEDARLAAGAEGPSSRWRQSALWLLGEAHLLLGDRAEAHRALRAAANARSSSGAVAQTVARARVATELFDLGDWAAADGLIRNTRAQLLSRGYEPNAVSLMVFAVDARVAIQCGDPARARDDLDRAERLWPLTSHGMPWLSIDALLHLVQAHLSASRTRSAEAVLGHAERIAHQRPDLGTLSTRLVDVRTRVAQASSTLVGGSVLTPAELRVVPFLPTHLSFQEIADRLTISRNTVKTHAMSIYGKLWVSSRDGAVRRGVELGLLEPHPVLAAESMSSGAGEPPFPSPDPPLLAGLADGHRTPGRPADAFARRSTQHPVS